MAESTEYQPIRVAVAHYHRQGESRLGKIISDRGLNVVLDTALSPSLLYQLQEKSADILLLDLGDGQLPEEEDYLEILLDKLELPIIFSDSDVTMKNNQTDEELGRRLAKKLSSLFASREVAGQRSAEEVGPGHTATKAVEQTSSPDDATTVHQETRMIRPQVAKLHSGDTASFVWILSGSMGGLDAMKRFLSLIPADLPVAFIVALQVKSDITSLLIRLLSEYTSFNVVQATEGHALQQQQVLIAPVDECVRLDKQGRIKLLAPETLGEQFCRISDVMHTVSRYYQANAGAIIFSGIGRTGIAGCRNIIDYGGLVWTQSAASSQFGSMPEYVRKSCQVSYTASPEMMARHLIEIYAEDNAEISKLA